MKIYTKTGDKGTTRLVDGSCVEKHNPWVEAYGSVDELNSYLGIVISVAQQLEPSVQLKIQSELDVVQKIQHHLFRVGSLIATGPENKMDIFQALPQIENTHIEFLESSIDIMTEELAPLKNFILPSGSLISTHTQFARTLCRRAERRVSEVQSESKNKETDRLNPVLIYLNRLSDYLFTLARFFSLKINTPEIIWDKTK